MSQITSQQFQLSSKQYLSLAQKEPIDITHQGLRQWVLMSADHYDWLKAASRRVFRAEDTPDVVLAAVQRAEMDRESSDGV